jgi:hypothetical protein
VAFFCKVLLSSNSDRLKQFALMFQSNSRFSTVLNLVFTFVIPEFVKYLPEMPLASGDEAR